MGIAFVKELTVSVLNYVVCRQAVELCRVQSSAFDFEATMA